jgi:hypothetical protein
LLDEKALAACLAYVDLNPVRAGLAQTPEESEYTAIADRIAQMQDAAGSKGHAAQPAHLLPFVGHPGAETPKGLPFYLIDYLELVDWTGRSILASKHGYIPKDQPPVLERLQIDPKHWCYMTQHFESQFKGLVDAVYSLKAVRQRMGYWRTSNISACQQLYA